MWTQVWKGSNPYSLNRRLVIIFSLIHISVVLQLCNISSLHYRIMLKYTDLLFDVLWPCNANMAHLIVKKIMRGEENVSFKA